MSKKKKKYSGGSTAKRRAEEQGTLDSWRFRLNRLTPEFRQFVDKELWPLLTPLHAGYKQTEKQDLTAHIASLLIKTGVTHKVVADDRRKTIKGVSLRVVIWDAFVEAGLCTVYSKGTEASGQVTRYKATPKILELRKMWELQLLEDLHLQQNTVEENPSRYGLVVLYSGETDLVGRTLPEEEQKQPVSLVQAIAASCQRNPDNLHEPDPEAVENGLEYFRGVEALIAKINNENMNHKWRAFTFSELGTKIEFEPNVCLRQVHSGKLFRGMRLYSWGELSGQGLNKHQRRDMLIDGEPAAEFDSVCHHIRMVYHLAKLDERGDLYFPDRVFPNFHKFSNVSSVQRLLVRSFVKTLTNIALYTDSRAAAIGAVHKALDEMDNRDFIYNLITNVEGTDFKGVLQNLCDSHPAEVSQRFFNEQYGMELQRVDGGIMLHTLNDFVVGQQKPALAIHDSLVVRQSDMQAAAECFATHYYQFLLHQPVLRREF